MADALSTRALALLQAVKPLFGAHLAPPCRLSASLRPETNELCFITYARAFSPHHQHVVG